MPARPTPVVAVALLLAGCAAPPPPLQPPEPPAVAVEHPTSVDWAPYYEFTGRLTAKDPVQVRPRVTGYLIARPFKEGEMVEKDKTLLCEIEKTLFDADLRKAKADVDNWNAQIKRADLDLERERKSLGTGTGSKADYDKAEAQRDIAVASLEAAKALVVKAEQSLRYCTVTAPVTGIVRQALVTEGNLVRADETVLTEIVPVDPVYAVWDVDEQTSLEYRRRIRAGEIRDPREVKLKVWAKLKNEDAYTREATVDYLDPQIERGTGTRTLRATFPNPPRKGPMSEGLRDLSPGDSIRVRVEGGPSYKAVTVPETAVFAQQKQRFVYVVNAKNEAELRPVDLGPARDGKQVIEKGVTPADRVIVNNLLRVRPGVPVKVQEAK